MAEISKVVAFLLKGLAEGDLPWIPKKYLFFLQITMEKWKKLRLDLFSAKNSTKTQKMVPPKIPPGRGTDFGFILEIPRLGILKNPPLGKSPHRSNAQ